MKLYLSKSFQRDANKQGVPDQDCEDAIRRAERGQIDADLGGHLIKQRILRNNQGAARGLRSVVFYRRGDVAVFLHLFPKSRKANLTDSELAEYLAMARILDGLTAVQLSELVGRKGWKELII